jgi:p-aminobenzoyl-glutamate transporter AbgT
MEKHVNALGALHIAYSAVVLLTAIIVFTVVVGGGILSGDEEAIAITSAVGTVIVFFLVLLAIPGIVGGIGLFRRRKWARYVVLALGFLVLLSIPLGTLLGIYTIWVLMKDETDSLFAEK